jgi:putative peptidoglycan lipid II flippase
VVDKRTLQKHSYGLHGNRLIPQALTRNGLFDPERALPHKSGDMTLAVPFTIVGAATLLSRVTGFVRDILVAALLGTSTIADVYVAAFLIPNLVRRMLSEGAFNASFVPRFARAEQEGGRQAVQGYAEDVLSLLAVAAIVIVMLAEAFMPQIMGLIAYGFREDPAKMADAVLFARIAFPFVGFTLVVALFSALLNSFERYAMAALVPVMLNVLLIGVMIVLILSPPITERETGLILVITVVAAGLIQFLLLWLTARRAGFVMRPRIFDALRGAIDPSAKTLLLLTLPGVVIAGSGHIHMVLASLFASLEPRGMAGLYYADRLFQLPLGFVAAAIGVVLLPRLARALQQGDDSGVASAQGESLVYAALIILPATAGLYVLADPIISTLFQRGAFTAMDAAATAQNLRILALALPAFVIVKIILPGFLARETMRIPVIAVFLAFVANIAAVLIVTRWQDDLAPVSGVAVGAWTNALILIGTVFGNFALPKGLWRRILGALIATMMMVLALRLALPIAAPWLDPALPFLLKGGVLFGLCMAGIAAYLATGWLTGAITRDLLALPRSSSPDLP